MENKFDLSVAGVHAHGEMRYAWEDSEVITIRSHTGLSGDMFLAGFAALALNREGIEPDSNEADEWLSTLAGKILPELSGCLSIRPKLVSGIRGWQAQVELPHVHEHRSLGDILEIIARSQLTESARQRSSSCFELLARCEAAAHGIAIADVHFHEVGALDSILDICAVCELYAMLDEPDIVCGPLPIADGQIKCAHGILPAPAPASIYLLKDFPVTPFKGKADAGELLTPTALTLLHSLDTEFGQWPEFRLQAASIIYGQREFSGVANGAIFAFGRRF